MLLFLPFYTRGLLPFPGNFLLFWYEPWRTYQLHNPVFPVAHKPVADDVFRQIYPFKQLAADMFRQGQMPLWNPFGGSGQPLLATMHAGLFNPFNLLLLLRPDGTGWGWYIVIQPLLLGLAMFAYLRTLGLRPFSSLFGTVVLMLSGFATVRYIYGDYTYALITLPLLLAVIEKTLRSQNQKWLPVVPVLTAFAVFATQPQILLYILGFAAVYGTVRLWQNKGLLLAYLGLTFLGFGIAAIQLIPTFELYRLSGMTTQASMFIIDRFLMPVSHLMTILIPNYFGNQGTYNWWGKGDYVETVAAVGMIPGTLAYIAWTNKRSGLVRLFGITIIVTLLLTLDFFGTRFLYHLPIPLASTGVPTRIYLLTTFALAVLSAYGLDSLSETKSVKGLFLPLVRSFLLLSGIIILTVYFYIGKAVCPKEVAACRIGALRNTGLESVAFLVFLSILALPSVMDRLRKILPDNLRHTVPQDQALRDWTMMVLVTGIGLYNASKFLPFSSRPTMYPDSQLITYLKIHKDDGRFFGIGDAAMATDIATALKIYDPDYYDPLYVRRYGELVAFANTGTYPPPLTRSDVEIVREASPGADAAMRRERLLSLLNVAYEVRKQPETASGSGKPLFADGIWEIFGRPSMARAYIVHQAEIQPDDGKLLARLFDPAFRPEKTVLLEHAVTGPAAVTEASSSAVMEKSGPNLVQVRTESSASGWLVMCDTWYPGWQAFIDGRQTNILRADYALRAVPVPAGSHTVRMEYGPGSFRTGLFISSISLMLSAGVFVYISLRKTKDTSGMIRI